MQRVVAISDTHNLHEHLDKEDGVPDGDILIHAGDFTNHGTPDEVRAFVEWFARKPHRHKILVAGNHERCLDFRSSIYDSVVYEMVRAHPGFTYLENSTVVVNGLTVYGSPCTPTGKAFCLEFDLEKDAVYSLIPPRVDILVTHTPPYGMLDKGSWEPHIGCDVLMVHIKDRLVPARRLRAHVFGHCHESPGMVLADGVKFINASTVNDNHDVHAIRPPTVFDV